MSNVLIGVIGVILFIGLALAGALFLGPRFQEATQNSKASASIQAVSQIANAVNLANLTTGVVWSPKGPGSQNGDSENLVSQGFLKSWPTNPVSTGKAFLLTANGQGADPNPAVLSIINLGSMSKDICDSIIKQTGNGQTTTRVTMNANGMTGTTGCIQTSTTHAGVDVSPGDYLAYARI